MPARVDSTSCTVGRSDEGLPSPRTNFQTMLKVTLILGQGHGAAASTARLCCSSRDALVLCIKCGHLPRTSSAPDHGGIDRRLACSTSHSKPRRWMRWHQDSFALPSRGRARSGRQFGHPHGPHSAAGHRRLVDYPARDRRSRALDTRSCQRSQHWRGPNRRDWLNSIPTDRPL
jgi:hypothetical protein